MNRSRQKERWIIYILAVLLCLVLASFWLMSNIYARYTSEASGSDQARVAVFGHSQSITLSNEDVMKALKPGADFTYTLRVANYDATRTSEVALQYSMEIVTAGNLPLTYTLYRQEGQNEQMIGSFTESSDKKTEKITNDDMRFTAGTNAESSYVLKVQWPADKNGEIYAGIPDEITVNIHVDQID